MHESEPWPDDELSEGVDNAQIESAREYLQTLRAREHGSANGGCEECVSLKISGVFTHEHGCRIAAKIKMMETWLEQVS